MMKRLKSTAKRVQDTDKQVKWDLVCRPWNDLFVRKEKNKYNHHCVPDAMLCVRNAGNISKAINIFSSSRNTDTLLFGGEATSDWSS